MDSLRDVDVVTLLISIPVIIFLSHVVGYLADPHGIRSIPGPFLAKFSDLWLGWVAGHGHRSELVHEAHMKYGLIYNPKLKMFFAHPHLQALLSAWPLTTSQLQTRMLCKSSTPMEMAPQSQISTMHSSPSNGVCSTREIVLTMLGNARLSPIYFLRKV